MDIKTSKHTTPAVRCGSLRPLPAAQCWAIFLKTENKGNDIMIIGNEKAEEMLNAAKPLMKWLSENTHPHCEVKVTSTDAELLEGVARMKTEEFVQD